MIIEPLDGDVSHFANNLCEPWEFEISYMLSKRKHVNHFKSGFLHLQMDGEHIIYPMKELKSYQEGGSCGEWLKID